MKGKKKADGGRTKMKVSGNPDVFKEADERKAGGRVKRKTGGKVEAAPAFMTGGAVRPRLDRPGRKAGGRVGANKSPLSTAHGGSMSGGTTPKSADSYGGTPPD